MFFSEQDLKHYTTPVVVGFGVSFVAAVPVLFVMRNVFEFGQAETLMALFLVLNGAVGLSWVAGLFSSALGAGITNSLSSAGLASSDGASHESSSRSSSRSELEDSGPYSLNTSTGLMSDGSYDYSTKTSLGD